MLLIKLCKNTKDFKWQDGFGFGVGTGLVIPYPYPYPTFGYRGKPKPVPIPGQLGYYPSKSGRIRASTHGYGFSCHVYGGFAKLKEEKKGNYF